MLDLTRWRRNAGVSPARLVDKVILPFCVNLFYEVSEVTWMEARAAHKLPSTPLLPLLEMRFESVTAVAA